jgi:ubiquitin-like modifier-activating enzyme ATG7
VEGGWKIRACSCRLFCCHSRLVLEIQLSIDFQLQSLQDLKKYNFYYWFAFPASIEPVLYEHSPSQKITEVFSEEKVAKFSESYKNVDDQRLLAFFMCDEDLEIKFLKETINCETLDSNLKETDLARTFFCFSDSSEFENPGWQLRNFIFALIKLCPVMVGQQIRVISVRQDDKRTLLPSRVFTIDLQGVQNLEKSDVKWTGWERNNQGKLIPKSAAMGDSMDPVKLSEHFSNLNLKLMKWRLLPSLNLDVVKSQKCLLFGAGTLGCATARNLLSWGVTDITLVDYGNVAFSNPVRQSLFTHEDAVKHKPKATTAAERLKAILPSINATGHVLQIPMPGHAIAESQRTKTTENLQIIADLIQSHDVLFLITDSRESRWLPTLLGAFYGKVRRLITVEKSMSN